jgi:hypothetical protein
MKRMILDNKFKAGQPLALRGQTAAWLLGLALAAAAGMNGTSVFAGVYDDFENPAQSGTLWSRTVWFGAGGQAVTNGQVRIFVTPDAPGSAAFSFLESVRTWKLQEGRTLEFRADLLSSNDDGAVAFMGFDLGDGTRGYGVFLDKDTLVLAKRANTPLQLFFLTNGTPVRVSNVKLVVSMTGVQSDVLLKFRILDNNNAGAVIFEREYRDTPGQDPLQVGPDIPPGNYLGLSGCFQLGLFRDAAIFDPDVPLPPGAMAEVVFDNAEVLEYDVPSVEITNSVLLSWSENTAEEQIVVAASSLASNAVWTPWPEPIFKRQGQLCMTAATTTNQQFFTLVPGTQFFDDFSAAKEPFGTRHPWVQYYWDPADSNRFTWDTATGSLRVLASRSGSSGQGVALPPGPDVLVRDFWASVDILDWGASTNTNERSVGLAVRGTINRTNVPNSNGYIGELWLNPAGSVGKAVLNIYASSDDPGPPFNLEMGTDYRLVFSGTGNQLTLRLFKRDDMRQPVAARSRTSYMFAYGPVSLWIANYGHNLYDFTLDNFFVTGTKP